MEPDIYLNMQSVEMKQKQSCIEFDNGGEYVYSAAKETTFTSRLRSAVIRQIGPQLKALGVYGIIRPKVQQVKPQCIGLPKDERVTAMMVYGHSKHQNPQLIVTSWPIDLTKAEYKNAKSCNDICENAEIYDCACHDPLDRSGDAVTYRIGALALMYSKHKYFSSMHSVINFKKFNLFNQEFKQIGRVPTVHKFGLPANGKMSKHILLHAQRTGLNGHLRAHIHLKVTTPKDFNVSRENMKIKITLSEMNEGLGKSDSCMIDRINDECLILGNAHFAHHILIENNGKYLQELTLSMGTNENELVPRLNGRWMNYQQYVNKTRNVTLNMARKNESENIIILHPLIAFALIALIGILLLLIAFALNVDHERVRRRIRFWRLRLFANASTTDADEDGYTAPEIPVAILVKILRKYDCV